MSGHGTGRFLVVIGVGLVLTAAIASPSGAQDRELPANVQAQVDAAIARGTEWLRKNVPREGSAEASLVCYALLKMKVSPETAEIVAHHAALLKKIELGCYRGEFPLPHFVYEAGCDAMFLQSWDEVASTVQLTEIRDFLIRHQHKSGAWYYAAAPPDPTGDTSITQYAMLGLWAIERAQLEVPREIWSSAARYFDATQRNDGGFCYHPFETVGGPHTISTASMTAAGLGSLALAELMLYGPAAAAPTPPQRRRFGVLEQRPDDGEPVQRAPRRAPGESLVSREVFKKTMPPAERTVARLFEEGLRGPHPVYFLYGCERAGSLRSSDVFAEVNWYERGVDFLLTRQDHEGFWRASQGYGPAIDTSFALLFLSRATKTLLPKRAPRRIAGGLLVGGRGLPENLDAIAIEDGKVKPQQPAGGVADLITQLEQPEQVMLPEMQRAVVEAVPLDDPTALVGQLEKLRGLLEHSSGEVRQVAVWAIGRSGEYREVPRVIDMLADPDMVVAWEASMALCTLARMPQGIIPAGESRPLPIQPPGTMGSADEAAIADWRARSQAAWKAWYQRVRPYDERDDRQQIRRP